VELRAPTPEVKLEEDVKPALAHADSEADALGEHKPWIIGASSSENEAEQAIIASAAQELEGVGESLEKYGANVSAESWRQRLRGATDVAQLCTALLACEADASALFDGLPPGAAHEDIEPQVAEAEVYEAEFVLPMAPVAEGADDGQGAAAGAGSTPKAEEGAGGAAAGGLEGTADGTSNPNATGASTPGAGLQSQSSQPAPPPPVQQQQQQRAVAKGPRGAAFLAAGGGQQGGGTAAQSPKPVTLAAGAQQQQQQQQGGAAAPMDVDPTSPEAQQRQQQQQQQQLILKPSIWRPRCGLTRAKRGPRRISELAREGPGR